MTLERKEGNGVGLYAFRNDMIEAVDMAGVSRVEIYDVVPSSAAVIFSMGPLCPRYASMSLSQELCDDADKTTTIGRGSG